MPDFTLRSYQKEIMDDLTGGGDLMDQTLKELEIINRLLGGNYVTVNGIEKILNAAEGETDRPVRIADLGCGGGDMLMLIADWGRKTGRKLELVGVDANAYIVEYARRQTESYPEITYLTTDIFSEEFAREPFDIMSCSLFTHHFTDEELTRMFTMMNRQSKLGFVVNDLHRHWFAYYAIKYITRWFSRSSMVQHDAPVSVLRAFSKPELSRLLSAAGVHQFSIGWLWAFRWQVVAIDQD